MGEWSTRQEAAVKNLERALLRCKKNGVALIGMDSDLLAFGRLTLSHHHGGNIYIGDRYGALREMQEQDKLQKVEDHGAYLDSGGW